MRKPNWNSILDTNAFQSVLVRCRRSGGGAEHTSLTPNTGAVGSSIVIAGANFGSTQGSSTVKFTGRQRLQLTGASTITATVPTGQRQVT